MSIHGSCLCGNITYDIDGSLESLGNCHCKMCQRFHGTAYATYGMLKRCNFSLNDKANCLRQVQSSAEVIRQFCAHCGSPLTYEHQQFPENIWVAAGTFDDDPQISPQYHIFVRSKAPWFTINDTLPQFDEFAPQS